MENKDVDVKKILEHLGEGWIQLGYANGWSSNGWQRQIVNEVERRGGEFEDVGTSRGDHTCTCEEFKVQYQYDSSD